MKAAIAAASAGVAVMKGPIGGAGPPLEAPGQLRLFVPGVDGAVADLVQPHRGQPGAPLQFRGQVVAALAGVGRDRAFAEGAERVRGLRHAREMGAATARSSPEGDDRRDGPGGTRTPNQAVMSDPL